MVAMLSDIFLITVVIRRVYYIVSVRLMSFDLKTPRVNCSVQVTNDSSSLGRIENVSEILLANLKAENF